MSLLAIDIGSSSCKAVVYALDGRRLYKGIPEEPPTSEFHDLA